jgi:hypothetical protein
MPSVVADLQAWIASRGGNVHPACRIIEMEADGRGIYATSALSTGQAVVVLPARCFLLSDAAKEAVPHTLWKRDPWEDDHLLPEDQTALALQLIVERRKGAGSELAAYIDSLPNAAELAASGFPLYWPDAEGACAGMAHLDGIPQSFHTFYSDGSHPEGCQESRRAQAALLEDARALRAEVQRQFATLRARCHAADAPALLQPLLWADYAWAWCMVVSRTFDCDGGGDGDGDEGTADSEIGAGTAIGGLVGAASVESAGYVSQAQVRRSAMVPFVDLVNHGRSHRGGNRDQHTDANVKWHFIRGGAAAAGGSAASGSGASGGGVFQVVTTRSMLAGEQLCFDYCPAASGRDPMRLVPRFYFELYYGFREWDGSEREPIADGAATSRL